jgi:ubiquinone/menaquinone biosynthesis C-methylase UbiE
MYVVAKHRITDAERFLSIAQGAAENAPSGVYGRQFCPSRDGSEAVCLWEADSVDAVEAYLDPLTGNASENAYFQVSSEHAIGIPEPIAPAAPRWSSRSASEGDVATNYERYFVPAIGAPLAADLVALAALRPGERVVDVACGTGAVTRLARERVGAGGTVAGIDVNPGMLAVARTVPGASAIAWHEASAEELPAADESFDVAFCQLGLQFFSDRVAALREIRRVLVPGGRLLVNVPGPAPAVFATLEDALGRHVGAGAAGFVGAVFSLYREDEVRALVTTAGFATVETTSSVKTLRLPPPADFLWQYVHSTPLAGAAAQLDEEHRAALEDEVVAAWQPFTEDGCMVVPLGVTVASARR